MATAKFTVILLTALGIPLIGFTLFVAPINFFQASVVWGLVTIFLTIRIYFWLVWAKQKTRKIELEIRNNELDLIEREEGIIRKITTDEN